MGQVELICRGPIGHKGLSSGVVRLTVHFSLALTASLLASPFTSLLTALCMYTANLPHPPSFTLSKTPFAGCQFTPAMKIEWSFRYEKGPKTANDDEGASCRQ